jgi:hypothetical protein
MDLYDILLGILDAILKQFQTHVPAFTPEMARILPGEDMVLRMGH